MPAWLKVKLNCAPGLIGPELNEPLSAVTVWAVGSRLVQVTFVPTAMVMVAGEKAKLAIEICCVSAGCAGAAA